MRQLTELSREQLEELAELVSDKIVIKQKEDKKKFVDNAYHNTRLLLSNYDKLKEHCRIVDNQIEEQSETVWGHWRLDLTMLMENKAKTVKIMKHVEKSLLAYKAICKSLETKEERRRYEIIDMKYLQKDKKNIQFIADRFKSNRKTIAKHEKEAIKDLSILLYGYEII